MLVSSKHSASKFILLYIFIRGLVDKGTNEYLSVFDVSVITFSTFRGKCTPFPLGISFEVQYKRINSKVK